jgi:hypothetical protein
MAGTLLFCSALQQKPNNCFGCFCDFNLIYLKGRGILVQNYVLCDMLEVEILFYKS